MKETKHTNIVGCTLLLWKADHQRYDSEWLSFSFVCERAWVCVCSLLCSLACLLACLHRLLLKREKKKKRKNEYMSQHMYLFPVAFIHSIQGLWEKNMQTLSDTRTDSKLWVITLTTVVCHVPRSFAETAPPGAFISWMLGPKSAHGGAHTCRARQK